MIVITIVGAEFLYRSVIFADSVVSNYLSTPVVAAVSLLRTMLEAYSIVSDLLADTAFYCRSMLDANSVVLDLLRTPAVAAAFQLITLQKLIHIITTVILTPTTNFRNHHAESYHKDQRQRVIL
jgi:hypothetical protein